MITHKINLGVITLNGTTDNIEEIFDSIDKNVHLEESISLCIEYWGDKDIIKLLSLLSDKYNIHWRYERLFVNTNMMCINITKTNYNTISLSIGPSSHVNSFISMIQIQSNDNDKECNND